MYKYIYIYLIYKTLGMKPLQVMIFPLFYMIIFAIWLHCVLVKNICLGLPY